MNNKILIVGSNGMLGKDLVDISIKNNQFEVFGINRKMDNKLDDIHSIICDITNEDELNKILKYINPNIIINCAANVKVDDCEKDKEKTYDLHVKATNILASFKSDTTKFVYISTDSVFNGTDGNYDETDKTNPLNYYALTKLEGEKEALYYNKNTLVLRTNIYGFHKEVSNSLAEWAISSLDNNKSIGGFKDVLFNPVYTKQLARVTLDLINRNYSGILNVASNEYISKYDFLIGLANKFKLNCNLINPIYVDEMSFNASRPKNTTLNTTKLKNILGYGISIDDGLEEIYEDLSNKRRGINI